jgi:hypothetical protein
MDENKIEDKGFVTESDKDVDVCPPKGFKSRRFDYVKYDDVACCAQEGFKSIVLDLEHHIQKSIHCPRSQALALTKLEEVYMWIGKGIRNDQLARCCAEEKKAE